MERKFGMKTPLHVSIYYSRDNYIRTHSAGKREHDKNYSLENNFQSCMNQLGTANDRLFIDDTRATPNSKP